MFRLISRESRNFLHIISNPLFPYIAIIGNSFMLLVVTVFYFLESDINPRIHSFLDCLWWGVATITSVGYGDIVPVTTAGKIAGMLLMYVGTILYVLFTGLLAMLWVRSTMEKEIQPIERGVRVEEHELIHLDHTLRSIEKRIEQIEIQLKGGSS